MYNLAPTYLTREQVDVSSITSTATKVLSDADCVAAKAAKCVHDLKEVDMPDRVHLTTSVPVLKSCNWHV